MIEKYFWTSEKIGESIQLYNRNRKHVATITPKKIGKRFRLLATMPTGEKIASDGIFKLDRLMEAVAKFYYASEL